MRIIDLPKQLTYRISLSPSTSTSFLSPSGLPIPAVNQPLVRLSHLSLRPLRSISTPTHSQNSSLLPFLLMRKRKPPIRNQAIYCLFPGPALGHRRGRRRGRRRRACRHVIDGAAAWVGERRVLGGGSGEDGREEKEGEEGGGEDCGTHFSGFGKVNLNLFWLCVCFLKFFWGLYLGFSLEGIDVFMKLRDSSL